VAWPMAAAVMSVGCLTLSCWALLWASAWPMCSVPTGSYGVFSARQVQFTLSLVTLRTWEGI
jgi:hypothetical protein